MTIHQTALSPQDRFGAQVAARLAAGTSELSYPVSERLRAARMQAVARRKGVKVQVASAVSVQGSTAALTFGDDGQSFWNRIASALPIIALACGLVLIHTIENDRRASEVAEVDAALLTDDLPPAAYADPGFIQFLKAGGN
ncbi:DUF3619 family protein [Caenimonas koreensis]|uniref:DUF3619 family protein n=1 Tax=Caenimonas koreensis DSM 17982 TaxID=1121255 RepID=A0A844B214_9BURK|nr:DUF3619 family protein [Caenimonas koreensis]MRD45749.1 DUF3619 family protein [Caenimonas koreensis DSM 17982]